MCSIILLLFFFSSRRRHTRFDCDWSSDVCSSDLGRRRRRRGPRALPPPVAALHQLQHLPLFPPSRRHQLLPRTLHPSAGAHHDLPRLNLVMPGPYHHVLLTLHPCAVLPAPRGLPTPHVRHPDSLRHRAVHRRLPHAVVHRAIHRRHPHLPHHRLVNRRHPHPALRDRIWHRDGRPRHDPAEARFGQRLRPGQRREHHRRE